MTDQLPYTITRDCPITCLAPLLSRTTLDALIAGVDGEPATVGQVIELYEQGRLKDIYNISSGRTGEVRWCLIQAKLIDPNSRPIVTRTRISDASASNGHHVSCLKA